MRQTPLRRPHGGSFLTLGYEGRTLEELLHVLRAHKVDVLVDVRQNAVSRKQGFSKRSLSEALEGTGIEYCHEPLLGNPQSNREPFRQGSVRARRLYMEHLNNGSRAAFDTVVELAMRQRVALLCFERDEAACHRRCIIEQEQEEYPALPSLAL